VLIENPGKLLNSVLLGNMTVNVLYFAETSITAVNLQQSSGAGVALIFTFISFLLLVLLGEMMPKSFSYSNSYNVCVFAAGACYLLVKILTPIHFLIHFVFVEPVIRLAGGGSHRHEKVNINQLKLVIDSIKQKGIITAGENQILGEIIELGWLKIRNVMKPRVDMVGCDIQSSVAEARKVMSDTGINKIVVYEDVIDNIVGIVHLRDLILNQPESNKIRPIVREVNFVPEQKRVESLFDFFQRSRTDIAVVVDEYGGIAGIVSLKDVIDEIIGQEQLSKLKAIEQTGPMEYRLLGSLPLHDWSEAFEIEIEDSRFATIAGLTTSLLGKIPKPGDVAYYENLKFTVEKVNKNRIETVILSFNMLEKES